MSVTAATPFYDDGGKAVYRPRRGAARGAVVPRRAAERVTGDAEILRFLEAERIPAERVVTALDGSATVRFGDRSALVTRFIPGRPPERTAGALEQMGATLGRMHALPAPAPGQVHLARRAGSLPCEDLALGRASLASAQAALPPELRGRHEALRRAVAATDDCEDLPFGLTHPDGHPATWCRPRRPGRAVRLGRRGLSRGCDSPSPGLHGRTPWRRHLGDVPHHLSAPEDADRIGVDLGEQPVDASAWGRGPRSGGTCCCGRASRASRRPSTSCIEAGRSPGGSSPARSPHATAAGTRGS